MANDGFVENGLKYRFFKTWQPGRTIYPMRNHCEHVWLLGTQEVLLQKFPGRRTPGSPTH